MPIVVSARGVRAEYMNKIATPYPRDPLPSVLGNIRRYSPRAIGLTLEVELQQTADTGSEATINNSIVYGTRYYLLPGIINSLAAE